MNTAEMSNSLMNEHATADEGEFWVHFFYWASRDVWRGRGSLTASPRGGVWGGGRGLENGLQVRHVIFFNDPKAV